MSKIYVDEIAGIASPSTVAIPGHVIQTVEGTTTSEFGVSTTSYVNTLTASITAKYANSKLMCFAIPARFIVYSGNEVRLRFTDGTNNSSFSRITSSGGIDLYYPPYIHGIIQGTHSAGASLTIALTAARASGANTNIVGDNGSTSTLVVMEIAG